MTLAAKVLILGCLGVAGIATPAQGQDVPAHFVHGIRSSGNTWKAAADRLAQEFAISQTYPNLPQERPFSEQATQLDAFTGATSGVIAVGHSNGGQVSRVWNLNYARNNRIVTVGSPHRGVRLATNILNGSAFSRPTAGALNMIATVAYYANLEAQLRGWPSLPISGKALQALESMMNVFYHMRWLVAQDGLGFLEQNLAMSLYPVLFDMDPTSSYWYNGGLNSKANISREAQAMSARVGVVVRFGHPEGIFFNALIPSQANRWQEVRYFAWYVAMSLHDHYYWDISPYTTDPVLAAMRSNAFRWYAIAADLAALDVYWLEQIGALGGRAPSGAWYYEESDGIVTETSQTYPNGTNTRFVPGITHTQETANADVYQRLRETFRDDFVVPLRATPPPSGTLSVSIDGPTQIQPGGTCTWYALSNAGSAPFSYQWTNNGVHVGSEYYYTGSKLVGTGGSSFNLRVVVTDAAGAAGERDITVYESSSAQVCPI